jgi:hypothetical protein
LLVTGCKFAGLKTAQPQVNLQLATCNLQLNTLIALITDY